jgi:steroid delta-isomerase-like uncharacterized protein
MRAVVRRCFDDIVARGDLAAAEELISEDLVFHTANGKVLRGRRDFQHFAQAMREAFPDLRFDIEEEICDGDRVATRYTMRGTFESTLMGLLPNGEEFAVQGIDTFRLKDGKVVEIHASYDTLGQMQQLDVVPKI